MALAMGPIGRLYTASNENGLDVEWSISNFDYIMTLNMEPYESPSFSFEDEYWNFKISPYNWLNPLNDISGFIDLCLSRTFYHDRGPSTSLEVRVSLKTVNGDTYLEKHATTAFTNSNPLFELMFRQFLLKSELLNRRLELLPSDVLTVVCTLKKSTSDESAGEHTTAECSFCKKTFVAEILLSHEKKCIKRPIKCPQCTEVILLQDWYGHECQPAEAEGEKYANLHRDFKELFIKQEDTDVILNVKGHEFLAHSIILKARSPVFASIFRHDMKENATGTVDIEDCDAASFSDFLCFLYCGDVQIVSHGNAFGLFFAADKYEISDLRAKCLEFIQENICVEMFCDTITLALRHTETKLIDLSTKFFIKNAENILETVKWQTFVDENPTQGNELFLKYVKAVKQ